MSEDKGAAVPRGAKSKLKPQPAREFICVVGGCCNTFNGWVTAGWKGNEFVWITGAPPRTRAEVQYYVNFRPEAIDIKAIPQADWRKHGWWEESVKELDSKKWRGTDLRIGVTSSHDIYWGNFVNPAARLFNSTGAWAAPLQRPLPKPGDLVTFLVYAPAYEMRGRVDFNASPYNVDHRLKPDAASYWGLEPGPPSTSPSQPGFRSPQDKKLDERVRVKDEAAAKAEPHLPLSEEDINFHVVMRTTGENTDEYIKKPKYPDHYMQYLHDELLNSVQQRGAMTKLLLVRTPQEIVNYISTGKWTGKPLDSYDSMKNWDNPSKEDLADETPRSEKNFVFSPPRPVKKDVHNRPLKWTLPWYPAWNDTPSVNRKKVLVHRFDYVGHSVTWSMMLQYGWNNAKGFMPAADTRGGVEISLTAKELDACFSGKVLTPDAHAMLWGCNLGATGFMDDGVTKGGLGTWIAQYFGGGVVAAEAKTSFAEITKRRTNMPTPDNGFWSFYPGPKRK